MGLLKTAGKVAVASAVHGRIQRRQQQRWAAQDLAAAQAAAAAGPPGAAAPTAAAPPHPSADVAPPLPQPADMGERLEHLTKLGDLLKAGLLTEAEFEQQKARILNG